MAYGPGVLARETNSGNITKTMWCKEHLAGTNICRAGHITSGNHLLHAEFNLPLECNCGRHGDHCAWLGGHGTAHGELDGDDGITVTVTDAIAASIESSGIVSRSHRAHKLACLGCSGNGHSYRISCGLLLWFLLGLFSWEWVFVERRYWRRRRVEALLMRLRCCYRRRSSKRSRNRGRCRRPHGQVIMLTRRMILSL